MRTSSLAVAVAVALLAAGLAPQLAPAVAGARPHAAALPADPSGTPQPLPDGAGGAAGLPVWFEAGADGAFHAPRTAVWADVGTVGIGDVKLVLPAPVQPVAENALGSYSSHFSGDAAAWRSGVPHYGALRFPAVAPGIDVVLHAADGVPEFDVVLQPGADLAAFRLATDGAELALQADGSLLVGEARLEPPFAYQDVGAARVPVASRFIVDGHGIGFAASWPFPHLPLTIDPKIGYGSFIGGTTSDFLYAVSASPTDPDDVYVAGYTISTNFPNKGAGSSYNPTKSTSDADAWVARFDTSLAGAASLKWVAFLGGSGTDYAYDIDVDGVGVFVTGITYPGTPNFPTTGNAYRPAIVASAGGTVYYDGYLARLSHDGMTLPYSTYLGGAYFDDPGGLEAQGDGKVAVVGRSSHTATDGPIATKNAFQPGQGAQPGSGGTDGFALKLDTNLSGEASLLFCTLLGGAATEYLLDVDLDPAGNLWIAGVSAFSTTTAANQYPTNPNAYKPGATSTIQDAVATMVPANGGAGLAALPFSTWFGGSGFEYGQAIRYIGPNVVLGGTTGSNDLATTAGVVKPGKSSSDSNDGFLAVFDPTKTGAAQLVSATYVGGPSPDSGVEALRDVELRGSDIVAFGTTSSTNFPRVAMHPSMSSGNTDLFVTRYTPGLDAILTSVRVGGTATESMPTALTGAHPGALNPLGEAYVGGYASTTTATQLAGLNYVGSPSYQKTSGGGTDAFFVRLAKAEPAAACQAGPLPHWRGVPIPFTDTSAAMDEPLKPKSQRWWFDTAANNDPTRPDAAFDADGDGQEDPGDLANPTWTYAPGSPFGTRTVRVEVKDASGLAPDTGSGTCTVTLTNRPPLAFLTLEGAPMLGATATVTARAAGAESIDPDAASPYDGLEHTWSLPVQDDCDVSAATPWKATCTWATKEPHEFLLVLEDADGGATHAELTVAIVDPAPVADFAGVPVGGGCQASPTARFTDASTPFGAEIVELAWDFNGDGRTDARGDDVLWTFPVAGTHTVRLTATDADGRTGSRTRDITVTQTLLPSARIVASMPEDAPLGAAVHLRDASVAGASHLASRQWTLPDGTTTSAGETSFTLRSPGDNEVRLTVTDQAACSDTQVRTFRPTGPGIPVPPSSDAGDAFVAVVDGPASGRPQQSLTFRDATSGAIARSWEVGGRTYEGDETVTVRLPAGEHEVVLTVRDREGRMAVARHPVTIAATLPGDVSAATAPRADAGPDLLVPAGREVVLDAARSVGAEAFAWRQLAGPVVSLHAADSGRATFVAPAQGDALVFELAVSGSGQRATDRVTVRVGPPATLPVSVTELGGGSFRLEARTASPVAWDFGDGQAGTGQSVTHTYLASGSYVVAARDGSQAAELPLDVEVAGASQPRARTEGEGGGAATIAGMPAAVALAIFGGLALVALAGMHLLTRPRRR